MADKTLRNAGRGKRPDLDDPIEAIIEQLQHDVRDELEASAGATAAAWKRSMDKEVREHRSQLSDFESRVGQVWKMPLDLYALFVLASVSTGSEVLQKYRQYEVAEHDLVFDTLVRLHCRGCYTASAIQALLHSGHANAANGLWRTMHELAVTTFLVNKHGRPLQRFACKLALLAY